RGAWHLLALRGRHVARGVLHRLRALRWGPARCCCVLSCSCAQHTTLLAPLPRWAHTRLLRGSWWHVESSALRGRGVQSAGVRADRVPGAGCDRRSDSGAVAANRGSAWLLYFTAIVPYMPAARWPGAW